ncbi:MAG TPA: LCP family protein [Conexibacter sp.]|nr:LCP family protein [Conexibacter sp.]
MADDHDDVSRRGERPAYTLYRSKPRGLRERLRGEDADLDELREGGSGEPGGPRRRLRLGRSGRGRAALTPRRVLKWVVLAVVAWLALSLVLFLVSAQIEQGKVSSAAKAELRSAGFPVTSANTILLLGSDARPQGSKEPGADVGGPSRSDTIMLWRVGGGHAARLSIPRDTVVNIPGHGLAKINAAYAYGGAALSIRTIEQYLGIPVNHLIEVSFENFPKLIDALGGVDVTTGRVCSEISGGARNGGWTLNLQPGTHHLDGRDALVLARTRKNSCNPAENDLTRAKRQQQILSAMKGSLLSPTSFFRLPWISWYAPKAMQTDMGGATLLGFFAAAAASGSPPVEVLRPSAFVTLPDGESALQVSPAEKQAAVQRFLNG